MLQCKRFDQKLLFSVYMMDWSERTILKEVLVLINEHEHDLLQRDKSDDKGESRVGNRNCWVK